MGCVSGMVNSLSREEAAGGSHRTAKRQAIRYDVWHCRRCFSSCLNFNKRPVNSLSVGVTTKFKRSSRLLLLLAPQILYVLITRSKFVISISEI